MRRIELLESQLEKAKRELAQITNFSSDTNIRVRKGELEDTAQFYAIACLEAGMGKKVKWLKNPNDSALDVVIIQKKQLDAILHPIGLEIADEQIKPKSE